MSAPDSVAVRVPQGSAKNTVSPAGCPPSQAKTALLQTGLRSKSDFQRLGAVGVLAIQGTPSRLVELAALLDRYNGDVCQ